MLGLPHSSTSFVLLIFGEIPHLWISLLTTKHLFLETTVILSKFKCQLNWPCLTSIQRDVFTGVWRDLNLYSLVMVYIHYMFFLHSGINSKCVRVLLDIMAQNTSPIQAYFCASSIPIVINRFLGQEHCPYVN